MANLSDKTGMPVSVVNQNTQSPIKAGTIISFAGATTPAGWLDCDGTIYAQATYPQLFAQIGATWATCTNPLTGSAYSAPTAGNFRVPDLRGAFQRGAGGPNAAGITTSLAGYQADLTARNGLGIASSVVTDPGHFHDYNDSQPFNDVSASIVAGPDHLDRQDIVRSTISKVTGITVLTTLTVGDAETRPDSVGVKYIIKAFDESFNLAGFALATPTTAGMVAARKGQYDLTPVGRVTCGIAGWLTTRGVAIYYQDQDGNHRLKFNIVGAVTSATLTGGNFAVVGVTFKNVANYNQCISAVASSLNAAAFAIALPNTPTLAVAHVSAVSTSSYTLSGDVELESKPSWA